MSVRRALIAQRFIFFFFIRKKIVTTSLEMAKNIFFFVTIVHNYKKKISLNILIIFDFFQTFVTLIVIHF